MDPSRAYSGGIFIHREDTKIGDIQPTLPFTEYDFLKKYRESFARNRYSESLLLFFDIHMANAATLAAQQLAAELGSKEMKRA